MSFSFSELFGGRAVAEDISDEDSYLKGGLIDKHRDGLPDRRLSLHNRERRIPSYPGLAGDGDSDDSEVEAEPADLFL